MTPAVAMPRPWRFLPERTLQPEAMDRTDLDPALRQQALEGLERLRRHLLRPSSLLREMVGILPGGRKKTLRIVELGAGTRELSAGLGRALHRLGRRVEMIPTDRIAAPGVRAFDCTGTGDWMDADLYFSNLLLHHLSVDDIRHSLGMQGSHARFGSLHLDLVRSRMSYYLTRLFLPILRYPLINQSDGLYSIQSAFTVAELRSLADGLWGISKVRRIGQLQQLLRCTPVGK